MKNKTSRVQWSHYVSVGCLCMCLVTHSGWAQQWEITPMQGYGIGGEFEEEQSGEELDISDNSLYALAVNFEDARTTNAQFEIYLSRQETRLVGDNLAFNNSSFDLDIDYYHIGGLLQGSNKRFKPFIVGTLGATRLDPKPSDFDSVMRFSMGLGGGLKLFLTDHIGLRLEGRAMMTIAPTESAFVSNSNGATLYVSGDVLFQALFNAGVIIKF